MSLQQETLPSLVNEVTATLDEDVEEFEDQGQCMEEPPFLSVVDCTFLEMEEQPQPQTRHLHIRDMTTSLDAALRQRNKTVSEEDEDPPSMEEEELEETDPLD